MMHLSVALLGASDPEMQAIGTILAGAGIPALRAVDSSGVPVNARTAYSDCHAPGTVDGAVLVVECDPTGVPNRITVDHHRPGDPGYGRPPAEYWEASSVGQVCELLGVSPTAEMRLVAAADHCLAHAYRGECPGVEPAALEEWRLADKAAFQGVPVESIREAVENAKRVLLAAPAVDIGGVAVRSLAATAPEMPEAASILGVPFTAVLVEHGVRKRVLMAAPPAAVEAFLAAATGSTYGDPARGFAGEYL